MGQDLAFGSSTETNVTRKEVRAIERKSERCCRPLRKDLETLGGFWLLICEMGDFVGFCAGI